LHESVRAMAGEAMASVPFMNGRAKPPPLSNGVIAGVAQGVNSGLCVGKATAELGFAPSSRTPARLPKPLTDTWNEPDALAGNFEEAISTLFTPLKNTLLVQHERFACEREGRLRDEIQLLRKALANGTANKQKEDSQSTCSIWHEPAGPPLSTVAVQTLYSSPLFWTHADNVNKDVGETAQFLKEMGREVSECNGNDIASPVKQSPTRGCNSRIDKDAGATCPPATPSSRGLSKSEIHSSLFAGVPTLNENGPPHRNVALNDVVHMIDQVPAEIRLAIHNGTYVRKKVGHGFNVPDDSGKIEIAIKVILNLAVLSNVVILGLQAGSQWAGWWYIDLLYAIIFSLELAHRVAKDGWYAFLFNSEWRWTLFDITLAIVQILEVAYGFFEMNTQQNHDDSSNPFSTLVQLRVMRVVRILRILRLTHVEFFHELGMMIAGAAGGMKTLGWSIVLVMMPVYAVSLLLAETVGRAEYQHSEDAAYYFSSVSMSMFTTFRCLVIDDCTTERGTPIFVHLVEDHGWIYGLLYCLVYVCMMFGLYNVIIAIYVESTVSAAKANESLRRLRSEESKSRLGSKMYEFIHFLYTEFSLGSEEFEWTTALQASMSREKFVEVIEDENVTHMLQDLGISKEDHRQLFDICDADGTESLSITEIVTGIRRLRGEPRRSDIIAIMLRVQEMQFELRELFNEHASKKPLAS